MQKENFILILILILLISIHLLKITVVGSIDFDGCPLVTSLVSCLVIQYLYIYMYMYTSICQPYTQHPFSSTVLSLRYHSSRSVLGTSDVPECHTKASVNWWRLVLSVPNVPYQQTVNGSNARPLAI